MVLLPWNLLKFYQSFVCNFVDYWFVFTRGIETQSFLNEDKIKQKMQFLELRERNEKEGKIIEEENEGKS